MIKAIKGIMVGNTIADDRAKTEDDLTHPFFALLVILVIAVVAANFIPSGAYERVAFEGRTIVDANSFEYVEKKYVGISEFFTSFYYGFKSTSGLMALIFFAGGAFGVVKNIGLLESAIKAVSFKLRNTHFSIIALVMMTLIGTQIAFTSLWELSIVMIPMVVPLVLALGYDRVVGASIVILAACAGFGAALTNPLFTAIAHKIAELPIYSAMWYRGIVFVVVLAVCYIYLMVYAAKVKKDPKKSLVYGIESDYKALDDSIAEFTAPLKRAGVAFLAMFAFLLYGVISLGFDFPEISATFVALAFVVGLAYGSNLNKICKMFGEGMKDIFFAATVMFFAMAVLHVLKEAQTIDTIIAFFADLVTGHSPIVTANLMLFMQSAINFFIPSGSGQALITMPIMVPLADLGDVNRQVAALASQLGDGFSNFIYPTNGTLLAILMAAGIPYSKWFKFFFPLFLILMVISALAVSIAVMINLGPF
ncbi:YfcC family protein [Oceanisphaera pacifica]|uniref:YfcC family protein n=1 Tax=Oceanisphaera pacifica TaxID=2818389 RepID=A0ABS3NJI6_9GAMM|nr:Na+/H+ antiporter NhaC family protein [Oceanisphaera pacifica]MBO1520754.1 YfcC family protein [Oceanisphaera pacifica]